MTATALIVTHDYYSGESLANAVRAEFGTALAVETVYRTYHMPLLRKGDIVISDGTCKDREDGGYSYPVHFDVSQLARKSGAAFIPFGRQPAKGLLARLLRRTSTTTDQDVIEEMRSQLG